MHTDSDVQCARAATCLAERWAVTRIVCVQHAVRFPPSLPGRGWGRVRALATKRHRIPPHRVQQARRLRTNATFPERLLWSRLRNVELSALKFRRQHVIGPYIVDFCFPAAKLIIEVDGMTHIGRAVEDRQRTATPETMGWRVVRYTNDQIIRAMDAVLQSVLRYAAMVKTCGHPDHNPPPTPPFQGGG